MKICVLIKQVPDKDSSIKIKPDNLRIDEHIVSFSTNESDSYALEEALLIKEKNDAEVIVITLGKESALQVIKDALAKGADRGIFINDSGLKSFDVLSIGRMIYKKIKDEHFDLIFSGLQSDDNGNSQLGLILAELLGTSHASLAMETELLDKNSIKVKRELENGWFQWTTLDIPASVTIQSGINTPRYASLKGIMAMKRKTIDKYSVDELSDGIETNISLDQMYIPEKTKDTQYIYGTSAEISEKLVDIFKNEINVIN